jgi:hypothetical protein
MRIFSLIALVLGVLAAFTVAAHLRAITNNIPFVWHSPYEPPISMLADLKEVKDPAILHMAADEYLRESQIYINFMARYVVLFYVTLAGLAISLLTVAYLSFRLASNKSFKPNSLRESA